jgi:hypothetical protein
LSGGKPNNGLWRGYFIVLFSVLSSAVSLFSQKVWDYYGEPEKGITVTGIVKGDVGSASSGSIKIYRRGKLYNEVFPGPGGKYEADLPFGDDYELEFSIPGCVTKRIKVETNLDKELRDAYDEPLSFNMALPKATNGPLDEAYEKPVSRLYFNNAIDAYERDMVTEKIFKDYLAAKQVEHKRWLEEQKEMAEREKEEAKRKAQEEAKQKAEEAARLKAEATAAERARREADEKARKEAEFLERQKQEQQRELDKLRQKEIADSIFRAKEKIRLEQEAAAREAERLRKEKEDEELWKKLTDKTAELEAKRQREISDSLFIANQQASQPAALSGTSGGGKRVYYDVQITESEKLVDVSAVERTNNWLRKIQQRQDEYRNRQEARKAERLRNQMTDLKRQEDLMKQKADSEQRRLELAQKQRAAEEAAEAIRRQRVQESLDKQVVVLVAYSTGSNKNSKYYGYVNFGDGKGPLELTEAEYRQFALKYTAIYNKQP